MLSVALCLHAGFRVGGIVVNTTFQKKHAALGILTSTVFIIIFTLISQAFIGTAQGQPAPTECPPTKPYTPVTMICLTRAILGQRIFISQRNLLQGEDPTKATDDKVIATPTPMQATSSPTPTLQGDVVILTFYSPFRWPIPRGAISEPVLSIGEREFTGQGGIGYRLVFKVPLEEFEALDEGQAVFISYDNELWALGPFDKQKRELTEDYLATKQQALKFLEELSSLTTNATLKDNLAIAISDLQVVASPESWIDSTHPKPEMIDVMLTRELSAIQALLPFRTAARDEFDGQDFILTVMIHLSNSNYGMLRTAISEASLDQTSEDQARILASRGHWRLFAGSRSETYINDIQYFRDAWQIVKGAGTGGTPTPVIATPETR
jgi:hypothetical protein